MAAANNIFELLINLFFQTGYINWEFLILEILDDEPTLISKIAVFKLFILSNRLKFGKAANPQF